MGAVRRRIRGRSEATFYAGVRTGVNLRRGPLWGPRLMPSVLLIGAQRSGTTSLFRYLSGHPEFRPPVRKEIHYFDLDFRRGAGWYLAHFPRVGGGGESTAVAPITGEASPYYLFHPAAAQRAASLVPDVKLIVLLRDPVQRARSQYAHERAKGYETLSFGDALAAEPDRLAGEEARLLADPGYRSMAHQHFSYASRGFYLDQLLRWEKHYGSERMLVLGSEQMFADPQAAFDRVTGFLGLADYRLTDTKAFNTYRPPSVDDATIRRLVDRFAPENERLFKHLGRSMDWLGADR